MIGFFKKKDLSSPSAVMNRKLGCYACGLYKDVVSPRIEPYGNFKKHIMVIGEAPGKIEDRNGRPWQGQAGKALERAFEKLGVDLFEDCVSVNAVNCRPPDNRTPTGREVDCCRAEKVWPAIEQYHPDMILLLGVSAVVSVIGHRWRRRQEGITKWRGWRIPDRDLKAWVCPTFHPSYVGRMDRREVDVVWRRDLEGAFSLIGEKLPHWSAPVVHYIEDLKELYDMKYQDNWPLIAFDFETTGLKPQAVGHRIVCCAVACSEAEVYVFPVPERRCDRKPLLDVLRNPDIDKIASNMKYEDTWARERLGVEVKGWLWDTMLAAHVLDNRPGISGLKFQAYARLGVVGYDEDVSGYLKAADANSINGISRLISQPDGMHQLLEYCGLDALYEYRIARLQMAELEYDFLPF